LAQKIFHVLIVSLQVRLDRVKQCHEKLQGKSGGKRLEQLAEPWFWQIKCGSRGGVVTCTLGRLAYHCSIVYEDLFGPLTPQCFNQASIQTHVMWQFNSWGVAPSPQTAKDDFSNVDAYAAQLGWYQLFTKKKGVDKQHLGFNMPVGTNY